LGYQLEGFGSNLGQICSFQASIATHNKNIHKGLALDANLKVLVPVLVGNQDDFFTHFLTMSWNKWLEWTSFLLVVAEEGNYMVWD
jgi:hypothetical protein